VRLHRFLCLAIAIIFLFNGLGYFVFILVKLEQAKDEAEVHLKHDLPIGLLTTIDIPTSDKAMCREALEGEFSLNGELYDVARTETTDDTLHCYCLNDKAETQLTQNLNQDEQIKSQTKQIRIQDTKTVVKSNVQINYFSINKFSVKSVFMYSGFLFETNFTSLPGFYQIDTPPPRLA